ncbi:MAG TPA: glycosyltransferase, partial [Firmicutes bacterium]|nr:glycosyltransferase [Bacillota bacterium]
MPVLDYILKAAQWLCFFVLLYYYVLAYMGLGSPRRAPAVTPLLRFGILIPAHNEERVLPLLLDSLRRQDYPAHLISVVVVADNCTDGTAEVARRHGATVLERTSPLRGKGYALKFGLDYLLRTECDAVCVLDADNLVDPRFLGIISAHFAHGAQVVQGRVETKNPLDSWVSASYAINFWLSNRMWQLARARAGLSSLLCGTGMCFRTDLLRVTGWPAMSLTEDLEYSIILISRGIKVAWAHEAVVFDEKPATFAASWRQRLRWLQGKWQVLFTLGPRLFSSAVFERNWVKMDGALCLLQPVLLLLSPISALIAYLYPSAAHPASLSVARHSATPGAIALALIPYFLPVIA